jgi:predicted Zn-dependent protease
MVRVEPGESLPQLAARVAPGAPVRDVVERIRNLNALDSNSVAAGQTLIAPIG